MFGGVILLIEAKGRNFHSIKRRILEEVCLVDTKVRDSHSTNYGSLIGEYNLLRPKVEILTQV